MAKTKRATPKPTGVTFKDKYALWHECLAGKDQNSIQQQVLRMVWDAGVYELINEARRFAPEAPEGGVQLNGAMHRFIDHLFFETQAVAIRRLTARESLHGPKGTYSLGSLITDMTENVVLLTRQNMWTVREPELDSHYGRPAKQQPAAANDALDMRSSMEEHWNEYIDALCGTSPASRSPNDTVLTTCFDQMSDRLKCCDKLGEYVNKYVAHVATPGSRASYDAKGLKITRAKLREAHEAICQVADVLSCHFLVGSSFAAYAYPLFDVFAYIDRPLVSTDGIEKLEETLNEYQRIVGRWSGNGLKWVQGDWQKKDDW